MKEQITVWVTEDLETWDQKHEQEITLTLDKMEKWSIVIDMSEKWEIKEGDKKRVQSWVFHLHLEYVVNCQNEIQWAVTTS